MNQPQSEFLTGIIERITFHSEESGYTVARLQVPKATDLITIIGDFANIQAGQTLKPQGNWREHPKYGPQFQVTHYQETKPATLTGLEKYLGSGLIKGVGPVTAKRIVAHFGLETLDIIENQSDRLLGIQTVKATVNEYGGKTAHVVTEFLFILLSYRYEPATERVSNRHH